jgi:hypothetical protein
MTAVSSGKRSFKLMNESLRYDVAILDVEPGDIVVTRDGTRRSLILKKEIRYGSNRAGIKRTMVFYTLYSLYFERCPNLVGITDYNIPLFEKAWRKVDNENN